MEIRIFLHGDNSIPSVSKSDANRWKWKCLAFVLDFDQQ